MNLFSILFNGLKNFVLSMNQNGIPLPTVRFNGKGSYPLTMFVVTFTVAIITLVGKITKLLGDVDYSNVLWLLGVTGSFWLAEVYHRKISVDGKSIEIGDEAKSDEVRHGSMDQKSVE